MIKIDLNKEEVVSKIKELKTLKEVGKYYNCCGTTIKNFLIRNNISFKDINKKLSNIEKVRLNWNNILQDISNKITIVKITDKYDIASTKYLIRELKENNIKLLPNIPNYDLTQLQNDTLIGLMLGDGSLSTLSSVNTSRLSVTRNEKDLDFLNKNYEIFKDFCLSKIIIAKRFDKRTNKIYNSCYFQSRYCKQFGEYRKKWYPNDIKIIPRDLQLNDQILYQWFCDDGCIISRNNHLEAKFATHGFTKEDNEFLCNKLNYYLNAKFRVQKENQKNGKTVYYIVTNSNECSNLLIKKIDPFFNDNIMMRKVIWK